MVTKRRTSVKTAFRDFVELVKDVPTLRAVSLPVASVPEIVTYIDRVDDMVFEQIAHAENDLLNRHLDIDIEFHTYCLSGDNLLTSEMGDLSYIVPNDGK